MLVNVKKKTNSRTVHENIKAVVFHYSVSSSISHIYVVNVF